MVYSITTVASLIILFLREFNLVKIGKIEWGIIAKYIIIASLSLSLVNIVGFFFTNIKVNNSEIVIYHDARDKILTYEKAGDILVWGLIQKDLVSTLSIFDKNLDNYDDIFEVYCTQYADRIIDYSMNSNSLVLTVNESDNIIAKKKIVITSQLIIEYEMLSSEYDRLDYNNYGFMIIDDNFPVFFVKNLYLLDLFLALAIVFFYVSKLIKSRKV